MVFTSGKCLVEEQIAIATAIGSHPGLLEATTSFSVREAGAHERWRADSPNSGRFCLYSFFTILQRY